MERGERYDLERRNPQRGFFFARRPIQYQPPGQRQQEEEQQIGSPPPRRQFYAAVEDRPAERRDPGQSSPSTAPAPKP